MTIKLKGSTDGSVSFTAPADTSPTGSDITLTLPTTAGSANQFVKNSGTAGTLEYSSMVETSTGVGMGTDSPAAALHVTDSSATVALIQRPGATSNVALEFKNDTSSMFCGLSTSAEGFSIDVDNNLGSVPHFTVKRVNGQIVCGAPTVSTSIDHSIITQGRLETEGTYSTTTSSAANVNISTSGLLARSTSSRKYKANIETMEDSYADAVLNARPVWFNSTAPDDTEHPEWGYWGFIAEEIHDIDPRLVFYGEENEEGNLEPEGVQYDRFVPHLINLVKRQKDQIADLTTRLEALEAGS
jgi:hypothetical protein